jgi:hypothetical protein
LVKGRIKTKKTFVEMADQGPSGEIGFLTAGQHSDIQRNTEVL